MRKLYCSRDSVSGTWQDPQAFANDQEAERSFTFALVYANIPEHFVKDIDLYCIGSFDESTGSVKGSQPRHICNGRCQSYEFFRETAKGNFAPVFKEEIEDEIFEEKESC